MCSFSMMVSRSSTIPHYAQWKPPLRYPHPRNPRARSSEHGQLICGPALFSGPVLVTSTSSARSKISRMSLSLSNPMARNRVVTGKFFLTIDISVNITLLISVANSIQDPLKGITRQSTVWFRSRGTTLSEENTRRTVQLGNDNTLRTVDHEGTTFGSYKGWCSQVYVLYDGLKILVLRIGTIQFQSRL